MDLLYWRIVGYVLVVHSLSHGSCRLQAAAHEGTSKWCRIHQTERSEAGWDWVLQHEFEASDSGACTAMCWRPHTASLPPMILLGTQHGAKVRARQGISVKLMPRQTTVGSLRGTIAECVACDGSTFRGNHSCRCRVGHTCGRAGA